MNTQIRKEQIEDYAVPYSGANQTVDLGSQSITTTGDVSVAFDAYGSGWNGSAEVPTKNDVYDKIESLIISAGVSSVNGQTGVVVLTTTNISEGSNLYFTDERAQDAVGGMVNSTLVYDDATPSLGRAAISGDITIASGSNTSAITAGVIVDADINASAAIDATKIGPGTISNTEFGYLNGVTSNIQTQLDSIDSQLIGFIPYTETSTASMDFVIDEDSMASNSATKVPTQQSVKAYADTKVPKDGTFTINDVKTFTSLPSIQGSPSSNNDATNKLYVDAFVQGLQFKGSVNAATTTALPANTYNNGTLGVGATLTGNSNGALSAQDGVTLTVNQTLLVKNESTSANNGRYVLTQVGDAGTPYILTRSTNYDTAAEATQGSFISVISGTTQGNTIWAQNSSDVTTIGTDAITFNQLSQPLSYIAGDGIDITGLTISVVPDFIKETVGEMVSDGQASSTPGFVLTYDNGTGALSTGVDTNAMIVADSIDALIVKYDGDRIAVADFPLVISTLELVTHTGTINADSIATFNSSSGDIKDSGMKITGTSTLTIQPTAVDVDVVMSVPTQTTTTPGSTISFVSGDAIQSGADNTLKRGGDTIIKGGAGWFDGLTTLGATVGAGGGDGAGNAGFGYSIGNYFKVQDIVTNNTALFYGPDLNSSATLRTHTTGYIPTDLVVGLANTSPVALNVNGGSVFSLTATGDRTINTPTGTAHSGQQIIIRHTASGANRTLTLTTGVSGSFRFTGAVPNLSVTTSGTTDYIGCVWNETASRWDVISYAKNASTSPTATNALSSDVQVFTSSGTWTKPTGAKSVQVTLIGGGGGGGSGRKGAAGTVRCGGGGGLSGGWGSMIYQASVLNSTETVTVGVGGAGGASVTVNTTNGSAGIKGGDTSFGTWLQVQGGQEGSGGTATNGLGGTGFGSGFPDVVGSTRCASGGSASTTGGNGASGSTGKMVGSGGGAGGGINVSNVAAIGGTGGIVGNGSGGYAGNLAGGTFGAVNSNGGAGNASPINSGVGGSGGGGGGASTTTNAGNGGNGALYGAGGGGGGAAVNAVGNSGAGGAGADGICIVTTYF